MLTYMMKGKDYFLQFTNYESNTQMHLFLHRERLETYCLIIVLLVYTFLFHLTLTTYFL